MGIKELNRWAVSIVALLAVLLSIVGCSKHNAPDALADKPDSLAALDVYKSPTCGCCADWIEHLEENGFVVASHHPDDLDGLKREQGITPANRSCHTAVSSAGYVFEGHVPARYIEQFLAAPVAGARGLAVPAMPVGSPGMEMGDRFEPYDVLLLKADGTTAVYARVDNQKQQY